MHLIFENLLPNLIKHWTGEFKGLDEGSEAYRFLPHIWEAIGKATAAAGGTMPSAYGARVPNIEQDRANMSAEMWSLWLLYIGPVVLRRRFLHQKYYDHFVELVRLVQICLQFEITHDEICDVRAGFQKWVVDYEKIYYQHNPERVSACPLTIHALLHIADSIEYMGPVWCYWAFPMERYCGNLQPALKSRRYPYASLDRYVVERAQMEQINAIYNVAPEMSLRPPHRKIPRGGYAPIAYPTCILLPPRVAGPIESPALTAIVVALATRFNMRVQEVRPHVRNADIVQYGRVRRVDTDEGDTIRAADLVASREDSRDADYVRYELYVDRNKRSKRKKVELELETFYGQLRRIYVVRFRDPHAIAAFDLGNEPEIVLASIRSCPVTETHNVLDIHYYENQGELDTVDITSIQALVGRVRDIDRWAIVDRSGTLARAVFDSSRDSN
ncbi:hypothetical protein BD626DRAFT_415516 [Schizophyllum amplum]|uniref:Uncharacterized protein n=1 Tax=Schizophyllum amplum TaxID=97359 RepID=A0A550BT99_9AGAR|nr:hypothetical protein BD626DRAFT_415516 [Auriculariopsis ampla]